MTTKRVMKAYSKPAYLMTTEEQGRLSKKISEDNHRATKAYSEENLRDRTSYPVLKEKQKDIRFKRTGAKDLKGISGY